MKIDSENLVLTFEKLTLETAELGRRLAAAEKKRDEVRKQLIELSSRAMPSEEDTRRDGQLDSDSGDNQSRAMADLVQAMTEEGGEADSAMIAKRLNITTNAANTRLFRAKTVGIVQRVGHGRYALVSNANPETTPNGDEDV